MCDEDEEIPEGYSFGRFVDVMTATHLGRIRDPAETEFPLFAWKNRWIPEWRWAQAHHLLRCRSLAAFRLADEPTHLAFDLLRHRAGNLIPHPGVKPLVDSILIYERDGPDRWLLESHLLLPELPSNLAGKLGMAQQTIDCYALWFFDVRRALSNSGWIASRALGPPAINGYADADLAPIWKRMAFYGNERILDLTVALTTGGGLDRYSEDERDCIAFAIEELRLSPFRQPKRVHQIDRRLRAELAGEHPSCYHMGRGRSKSSSRASSVVGTASVAPTYSGGGISVAGEALDPPGSLTVVDQFGEYTLL